MDFYTNVIQWGNFLLVRGVSGSQRLNFKVKYSPTLFVPVLKETEWKTLEGKSVTPYKCETIKGAKDFEIKAIQVKTGKFQKEDCLEKFVQPDKRINSIIDLFK